MSQQMLRAKDGACRSSRRSTASPPSLFWDMQLNNPPHLQQSRSQLEVLLLANVERFKASCPCRRAQAGRQHGTRRILYCKAWLYDTASGFLLTCSHFP